MVGNREIEGGGAMMDKSKSVDTPAKPDAILPKKQRTILHVDYTDAVLAFTSVFLAGFGLGIIFGIGG